MTNLDLLQPCDRSIPEGLEAILQNLSQLKSKWRKNKGMDLRSPSTITRDMVIMRELIKRCRKGDFRYKESELQAMKSVAQWTVDMHMQLLGKPIRNIDWNGNSDI